MLSTIGRAAVSRVGAGGAPSAARRVGQFTSKLQRVRVAQISTSVLRAQAPRSFIASRRTYATTTKKTGTAKAKKAPAKKPASTKAKKPASKTTKKAAPKKKVAKVLTPEKKAKKEAREAKQADAKAKLVRKELKATALLSPPKPLPETAWTLVFAEQMAKRTGNIRATAEEASQHYKSLSAAQREELNHRANQNKEANDIAYKKWVESHTPEQVRLANLARLNLKRKDSKLPSGGSRYTPIHDSRQVKRPTLPLPRYVAERFQSGDLKGITFNDATAQIAKEWQGLSTSEKKPYLDAYEADKARYVQEYKSVYHHDPPSKVKAKATT